ncbi:MAG: polynucleotide adenylyltransferase PcnB [Leptospiraceae bacterium]|nr:polynucleotide adenylyltransferase PcnB [Leptospiraceae bacterium]MCB1200965.1 polynucleotide adenylyltransferase PcnB [Leptospiraceae bacterium]
MLGILKRFFLQRRAISADKILKYPEGKRIYSEFHHVRQAHLDSDAVKVIGRLQQFGYKAYLVGGGVRDLLLNRLPKDYDIVTNARPNDVKKIFNNSRLIGKRFRIVHIVFRGNKIIEVSTARSLPENRRTAKDVDELMLKKDNQYGTFKEDVARRDFTLNSLLFDVRNETIIDYCGGFEDLQEKIIRIIGDEDISLPEDPVRILRAIKFAGLLDFSLHPKLVKGINKHRKLLLKASQARLHEEYNKIFRTGQSLKVFGKMVHHGLFEVLFPEVASSTLPEGADEHYFLQSQLGIRIAIGDRMIQEHEDINTTIYYALLIADYMLAGIDFTDKPKTIEKIVRDKLIKIEKEFGLTRKEVDRLTLMFATQSLFGREAKERKGWVRDFQETEHFAESFTLYKIIARARNDEESIQRALFWEIGLRKKLPQSIRKVFQRSLSEMQMQRQHAEDVAASNSRPRENHKEYQGNEGRQGQNGGRKRYRPRRRKGGGSTQNAVS